MKRMCGSAAAKLIAIILAACGLVLTVGSVLGIAVLGERGLYGRSLEDFQQEQMDQATDNLADTLVRAYIQHNLSNMTEELADYMNFYSDSGVDTLFYESLQADGWYYAIRTAEGKTLESGGSVSTAEELEKSGVYTAVDTTVCMYYPRLVHSQEMADPNDSITTPPTEKDSGVPTQTGTVYSGAYDECYTWYNEKAGAYYDYYFLWLESPEYTVSLLLPTSLRWDDSQGYLSLLGLLIANQHLLSIGLVVGLAVFVAAGAFLCCAAGRKNGSGTVCPGGLNRLPLDVYAVGVVFAVMGLCGIMEVLFHWLTWGGQSEIPRGGITLFVMTAVAAGVAVTGWLFALAAQCKAGGGYWWRNSLIGRVVLFLCRWLRRTVRWGIRLISMFPVVWQWITVAAAFGLILLLLGLGMTVGDSRGGWFMLFLVALAVDALAVCYSAYAFGVILTGVRRMAEGNLNRKIPTGRLIGCFADCAKQLNTLAGVAEDAARNQLKSERMKTELITNVSHDIKTPLTSIINYVDLLQKSHTPQQEEEYLGVLARQSQRMKKLIEDLMEMSKAATGNMTVEIARMDAVEAVNQALGEFSDKLAAVPLTLVFHQPEEPIWIRADGRLMWRTLSNLLQNAVKYAQPGTRLYVDIARVEEDVVISLKNISRDALNISADELMERFVRGDASRNTEGSGLGLNIARSLMEIQRGKLRLLVDGDLFKVSMIFPAG